MTTYKRIDGDYHIQTIDPPVQKVYIDTDATISGNLTVRGNLTYIDVSELNIADPFILLNASNTSSYSANSGVLTHITSNLFAGIRYSSDSNTWEISVDTSSTGETGTWSPVPSSGSIAGGANTEIQYNDNGGLGANANFSYDYATSKLTLQGHEVFGNIGTAPVAVANSVAVYHNAQGSAGTGLYVKSTAVQDELVSKNKAILFGLVF